MVTECWRCCRFGVIAAENVYSIADAIPQIDPLPAV